MAIDTSSADMVEALGWAGVPHRPAPDGTLRVSRRDGSWAAIGLPASGEPGYMVIYHHHRYGPTTQWFPTVVAVAQDVYLWLNP